MIEYKIIGLMSGTSLDGLDIAYVKYSKGFDNQWNFEFINASTFSFPIGLEKEIRRATQMSVTEILQLDKKIGKTYALFVNQFLKENNIEKQEVDVIASHGQTIFHQPKNGFTYQIGCGTTIAFLTGINVINDFRTKDVVAGGQGAPLVPIGDYKLFRSYADSFLNIGGFANVSFEKEETIYAFDICPGNLPLNKLINLKGLSFDRDGLVAKQGEINFYLLEILNNLSYYSQDYPKSLGTEWLENEFYPLIKFDNSIEDNLRTILEHEAIQISNVLNKENLKSVLITGGGVKNLFLIERIKKYYQGEVVIPSESIVDFKEAIIFGFLGALYLANEENTISSVTGAEKNVSGGVLHKP